MLATCIHCRGSQPAEHIPPLRVPGAAGSLLSAAATAPLREAARLHTCQHCRCDGKQAGTKTQMAVS
jgi:hypothetical protein